MNRTTWTRFVSPRARDVIFDLVVQVLWADGRVTPDELSAARGAADALGLDTSTMGGLFGRVGRAFETLPLSTLGPLERPMAYAAAVWMAMADRQLAVSENVLLRRTASALGIEHGLARQIESMARKEAGGNDDLVFLQADERRRHFESLLDAVSELLIQPARPAA